MDVVYLARHGETAWNALGKLQGHTDIPLNDAGRVQARALADVLEHEKIGAIVTSDLSRARETGEVVAERLAVRGTSVDPELRERRFGVFEGLTRAECAEKHPESWKAWMERTGTPPGGETREDATARLSRALSRIAALPGDDPVLAISHGGVMRLWLMSLLGADVPLIANGTIYRVEIELDVFRATLWQPTVVALPRS